MFLALSSTEIRDCVKEDKLEEFDSERWNHFANPEDVSALREPGLWKIEAQGDRICYISSKLYHLSSTETGATKTATRGVSKHSNADDVAFDAFRAAVDRPLRFAAKLEEMGVAVVGPGKLNWRRQPPPPAPSPSSPTTSPSPPPSPPPLPPAADPDLYRLQERLVHWLNAGAADEEVHYYYYYSYYIPISHSTLTIPGGCCCCCYGTAERHQQPHQIPPQ